MSKKANYSYVGIAFVILVFGIIFIPRIIDRISNEDIRRNESRSDYADDKKPTLSDLEFLEINGVNYQRYNIPPQPASVHVGSLLLERKHSELQTYKL